MKGTTVVLVVLNTYVHYGDDLEPIDELEKKVRQAFCGFTDVKVSFLITNENVTYGKNDEVDAIAFYYPRLESMYKAFEAGVPVLNFDSTSDSFKFVGVRYNGYSYEVCPISFSEMLKKVANTNK